jgi:hypothetical protein
VRSEIFLPFVLTSKLHVPDIKGLTSPPYFAFFFYSEVETLHNEQHSMLDKSYCYLLLIVGILSCVFLRSINFSNVHFERDLCGVKGGDESSCQDILLWAGVAKGTPKWRLRNMLLEYVNLHHKIMDPADSSVPKRYVVIDDEPLTGLGNRFQVMVSVFLYAMLSRRAILIDWPEVKPSLHWNAEESVAMLPMHQLLENPGFDWDYSHFKDRMEEFKCANQTNYKEGDDTWFQCCSETYAEFSGNFDKFRNGIQCRNISRYRGVEEIFQCGLFAQEPSDQVVRIMTWEYFVPQMELNPYYRHLIRRVFQQDSGAAGGNEGIVDVFTPLCRFLLRPVSEVRSRINKFKRDHFGDFTLGLQIRRVGINKLNETQEDIFWNCAVQTTADHILESAKKKSATVKWFLATDSPETRQRALEQFGDRVVINDAPISRNNSEGIVNGFIDMWLLSECDDIIVSAASTYGKIAFGLRGISPKYVNRQSQCVRRSGWQPCFFQFEKFNLRYVDFFKGLYKKSPYFETIEINNFV